jgi:hypothetical protein
MGEKYKRINSTIEEENPNVYKHNSNIKEIFIKIFFLYASHSPIAIMPKLPFVQDEIQ